MENDDYKVIQRYRRWVSKDPRTKGLVRVADAEDRSAKFGGKLGCLYGRTMFFLLARGADLYWAKRHFGEFGAEEAAAEFVVANTVVGAGVIRPTDLTEQHGIVFPFQGDIYRAQIIHYDHRRKWLSRRQVERVEEFAAQTIETPNGPFKLPRLTDFQIALKPDGDIAYIDFCPWPLHYKGGDWVKAAQEIASK